MSQGRNLIVEKVYILWLKTLAFRGSHIADCCIVLDT